MLFVTLNSLESVQESLSSIIQGLEFRLDRFSTIDFLEIRSTMQRCNLPILFTLRKASHGGAFQGNEEERLCLIEKLMDLHPHFFDLEHGTSPIFLERMKKTHPEIKLILSYHNFSGAVEVKSCLDAMQSPYASYYKLACMPPSSLEALKLLQVETRNVSVLGMGEFGEVTRILSPVFGNAFNYTSFHKDRSPMRQISADELEQTYNYKNLSKTTSIFALIGDPVDKSPSHLTHNAVFKELGLDAIYVKIPLYASELQEFFSEIKRLPFKGLSITMPHKEKAKTYVDRLTAEAEEIRAINTCYVREKVFWGTNTDGLGALDALEEHLNVRGKQLVILGAGGTARAIAHEALRRRAHVTLLNRTVSKVEAISHELGCSYGSLKDIPPYDILINATSVGMQNPNDILIDPAFILPQTVVMDVVQSDTLLLKNARQKKLHNSFRKRSFPPSGAKAICALVSGN